MTKSNPTASLIISVTYTISKRLQDFAKPITYNPNNWFERHFDQMFKQCEITLNRERNKL